MILERELPSIQSPIRSSGDRAAYPLQQEHDLRQGWVCPGLYPQVPAALHVSVSRDGVQDSLHGQSGMCGARPL